MNPSWRLLVIPFCLSLLVHMVGLNQSWIGLVRSSETQEPESLKITLQPLKPSENRGLTSHPQPITRPLPPPSSTLLNQPIVALTTAPTTAASTAVDKPDAQTLPPTNLQPTLTPPVNAETSRSHESKTIADPLNPTSTDKPQNPDLSLPGPRIATENPSTTPLKPLPANGRITFALYLGAQKFQVASTQQSWQTQGHRYQLDSFTQTQGLVQLFHAEKRIFKSSGEITQRGLRPEHFYSSRERSGKIEQASAHFKWDTHKLILESNRNETSTQLEPGSQDLISFIYQFSLAPPATGRLQLPITNGYQLEQYELEVLNEEILETPLGSLKTIPVKQIRRTGKESIEIWLATDYHYLPVRVRFIGRDGTPSGEQMVTAIDVDSKALQ